MLATTEGERPILIVRDAWLLDLGRRPYREVWEWQKSLVDRRADDRIPDGLILVEHEPIATLGRRGKREDVLDPSLEIVEVERGGEATYHGPGQLVGYPILKLPDRLEVKQLVTDLEEVLIRTCRDFGIEATREGPDRGVWVGGKKIASIGLAVRRSVTFHGFALNVTTDLREFLKIRPCGHDGGIMTSMAESLGRGIDLEDVKASVIAHFQGVFGFTLRRVDVSELLRERPAVDGLARRGNRSAEPIRELLQQGEVLRVGETVSSAHDDVGLLGPQAPFLRELLELQERCVDILRFQLDRLPDDLTATIRIVRRRDEHVPPDGGHLWPVLLAQDVGQAFPAETWPDHVEVAFGVDVELDAIRGEPGLQEIGRAHV